MPRLIRFSKLVNSRTNTFKPCPNCGQSAVKQTVDYAFFSYFDPKCHNCHYRFVMRKIGWFRRQMFQMVSAEEYQKMIHEKIIEEAVKGLKRNSDETVHA